MTSTQAWSQIDESLDAELNAVTGPPTKNAKNSFQPTNTLKSITLKDILEEGLRLNPSELVRQFDRELLDLGWRDTYDSFWFPNLQLTFNTDKYQRIDKWRTGNSGNTRPTNDTADGSIGLELGDYTLFNWGIDYLDYLSSRNTFFRAKKSLDEQRRNLKLDLIAQYFELHLAKAKLLNATEQLRHFTFVYRMTREKASLKKVSRQEYYQARTEYIKAQKLYQEAKIASQVADEKFAYFIGDQLATNYNIRDRLTFKPLKMELENSLILAHNNAPHNLDAKTTLENAQRDYEKSLKEDLPLPKFTVDLGTYKHSFDKNGWDGGYNTIDDSKNLELVASINATWTIVGDGGFLNSRKRATSLVQKHKSERLYFDAKREVESSIRQQYKIIQFLEKQFEISKSQKEAATKNYDIQLQTYLNGQNRFNDLKDAVVDLNTADNQFIEVQYYHLKNKIMLAKTVGLDDFPGESFEDLAVTEVR
jgi:outer membrane protein TolC